MRNLFIIILLLFTITGQSQSEFPEYGKASFYADKFVGKLTASGEKYKPNDMTAAHKSLPFGTKVKVTNLTNSKSVIVRINDRGPYVKDRIIDLSLKAAEKLEFTEIGIVDVKVELTNEINENETEKEDYKVVDYSQHNYYKVNSVKIEPAKYGIQVGSYTDSGNLLKTINDFSLKFTDEIIVQESSENGSRKYRLIVGNFLNRNDAEAKLQELRKEFSDCFILNLE